MMATTSKARQSDDGSGIEVRPLTPGRWGDLETVCFVVPAPHRSQGVARQLLAGAIDYAARRGAKIVEAYPVDRRGRCADDTMSFGAKSMFDAAGFEEVARRKPARPVVRLRIGGA